MYFDRSGTYESGRIRPLSLLAIAPSVFAISHASSHFLCCSRLSFNKIDALSQAILLSKLHECSAKADFSVLKFLTLNTFLLPRQKSTPGLANVLYITIFAWNRVNNACFFLINNFIFYIRYHISKPSSWFLHNFQTMLLQNTFNLLAGALNIGNHYIPLALLSVRRFRIQFFMSLSFSKIFLHRFFINCFG